MNSATNVSPQRPLIPPKPDKDKILSPPVGLKRSPGLPEKRLDRDTDIRKEADNDRNPLHTQGLTKSQSAPSVPPHALNHNICLVRPRDSTSLLISPQESSSLSPLKPALPPKPVSNSVSSPPRKSVTSPNPNPRPPSGSTQAFSRSGNSVSIANSILANRGRHSLDNRVLNINPNSNLSSNRRTTDGFFNDSETPKSPPAAFNRNPESFVGLRSFNKSTSEPVSPRPTFNNNPRPFSSVFTFPSPDANINSPGFSSANIRTPTELRGQSASLGRNVTPPSSGGISGFFSNKAATLSRMLPLDLHFGKTPKKSKTQPPMHHHIASPASPIQNMGRNISFSTGGSVPPPPPPRLKKKLSPVNSLSPVSSISPTSPPPVFSPLNPIMTSVQEEPVIYAEVDKEKKWAQRKLKQETEEIPTSSFDTVDEVCPPTEQTSKDIKASLVISITHGNRDKSVNFQSQAVEFKNSNNNNTSSQSHFSMQDTKSKKESPEAGVDVDSWLGKYLPPVVTEIPQTNPRDEAESRLLWKKPGNEQMCPDKTKISDEKFRHNAYSQSDSTNLAMQDTELTVEKNENLVENNSFLFKLDHSLNQERESSQNANNINNPKSAETHNDVKSGTGRSDCNNPAVGMDEIHNTNRVTLNQVYSSVNETETNVSTVEKDNSNGRTDEIPDTDAILSSVDAKIQSAVSLLSNLSGNSSPIPSMDIPSTINSISTRNFESLSISEVDLTAKPFHVSVTSPVSNSGPTELLSPLENQRRRSWNCSDSSSPCESSSSSLSNLILRDRSYTYSTGKPAPGWADEGELSTGALGDVESSDAQIPYSSTEDMGSAGSISRKKKNWLFSSFGKGGSSSSSSNGNRKSTAKPRHKDKTKSFTPDTNGKVNISGPFGRQISDSICSTAQISGAISLPSESSQLKPSQFQPTVQFSPDPPTYRYRYSEGSISEGGETGILNQLEELQKGDNDSVCSANSANAVLGGYEDILAELSPKDKKSFYVAREILSSEQTFVDVLDLLTIEFPNSIKEAEQFHGAPIIPPQDIDNILAGLSHLKLVNKDLLVDLQNRIRTWKENPKLADIIVKKGPFLKHYAHYIKNFEKTNQHLDGCCQRYPLFAKALSDFEMSDKCQKLGLKHYMLKPVQRMPQYGLLLKDYLKSLDEDSIDYKDSIQAIAIVNDVAEHANEAIRLQENAEKLTRLQSRLVGIVIMKADRLLLKEGELMKVCRKGLQPRFFALMNDCLMCMSYNVGGGSDLKSSYDLPLAGMRIEAKEDNPNEFSVISVQRSFNIVAKTPREREDWMKALNNAIRDNIKKRTCTTPDPDQELGVQLGKVAPVWIADKRVTMCQICTAEFTVTFRRHHCRACGKVVCGHCSGNQAPLPYLRHDSARVCDECYQYLLEEFDKESRHGNSEGLETNRETMRARFRKDTPNVSKRALKRNVPPRLELHANNSGSRISNYLHWRERKAWKRHWFVLMDRVLYIYAASEDIAAIRSFPVLGWDIDYEKSESMEGGDTESVFKLTHTGQNTILFQAENPELAERWVAAMKEATVLA